MSQIQNLKSSNSFSELEIIINSLVDRPEIKAHPVTEKKLQDLKGLCKIIQDQFLGVIDDNEFVRQKLRTEYGIEFHDKAQG